MKSKSKQSGVTLTEMTVVVGAIALLVAFGLPATRTFFNTFESGGSAKGLISAGLASARAIAASKQHYAGIRFQKAYNPDDPFNPLNASQYMVFIVHDFDGTGFANGFRAVEGLKPIKLPDSVGVMDLYTAGAPVADDSGIDNLDKVRDTTTFSIIFSPSGKMIVHNVRVRNRDGAPKWPDFLDDSEDDVFNTQSRVADPVNPVGMFIQDDYPSLGLTEELSRNSFIIYDRKEFKHAYENGQGYSDYLVKLVPIYISPYTGTIISVD